MLTSVVQRYQQYDPISRTFTAQRSMREYAEMLGISHATLSELYRQTHRQPSTMVLRALARLFPVAADDISVAMTASTESADEPIALAVGED